MFTIDPTVTDSSLKEKTLVKALFSMNNHEVATPEMNVEEARSYVFFFREGKARRSAFIGLHLLRSDRKLYYKHSSNPFPEEEMLEVEEDARGFAEDLGAMLDEIDFAFMSESERQHWIDGQSIFSQKKQPEAEPVVEFSPGEQLKTEATPPVAQAIPETVPEILTAPVQPTLTAMPAPVTEPRVPPLRPATAAKPAAVPEPPVAPVQPASVPRIQEAAAPVSAPATPEPLPFEPKPKEGVPDASPRTAPYLSSVQPSAPKASPLAAATKKRQEIMQNAIKAAGGKPLKQSLKNGSSSSSGVVSRDREALARLLTSF